MTQKISGPDCYLIPFTCRLILSSVLAAKARRITLGIQRRNDYKRANHVTNWIFTWLAWVPDCAVATEPYSARISSTAFARLRLRSPGAPHDCIYGYARRKRKVAKDHGAGKDPSNPRRPGLALRGAGRRLQPHAHLQSPMASACQVSP